MDLLVGYHSHDVMSLSTSVIRPANPTAIISCGKALDDLFGVAFAPPVLDVSVSFTSLSGLSTLNAVAFPFRSCPIMYHDFFHPLILVDQTYSRTLS